MSINKIMDKQTVAYSSSEILHSVKLSQSQLHMTTEDERHNVEPKKPDLVEYILMIIFI